MLTNYFVDSKPLHYDRKTFPKINLTEIEPAIRNKSLFEIRKEIGKMHTGKKITSRKINTDSDNIVEKAIGYSTNDLLESLETFNNNEEALPEFEDTIQLDDISDTYGDSNFNLEESDEVYEDSAQSSNNDAGATDKFNETDELSSESGEVNLVTFFRKVVNLNQLIKCAEILNNFEFYFTIEENDGPAIVSELFTAIDRINPNKDESLIRFASKNYTVFTESLNKLFNLAINNYSGEVKDVLVAFEKCMK